MIKNIIEAYDGAISFTSKEGIGTVFTVILPKI
jgi:signal transduction histidine kinase